MVQHGSGRALDAATVTTCLRVIAKFQNQLDDSCVEAASVARLTRWLGAFVETASARLQTELEALDDPRGIELLLPASCLFRDGSMEHFHATITTRSRRASLLPETHLLCELSSNATGLLTIPNPVLQQELDQITDWNKFDVFAVKRLSKDRPLQTVTWALLQHFDIVNSLKIPEDKLRRFLKSAESLYNNNPYHNSQHAADVTQNVGVLLADGINSQLGQLEILACILAACVHDMDHPGYGNAYMVNTATKAAITYNDNSVNENMHAAEAFRLLRKDDHDFLSHLPPDEWRFLRRTIIAIILATDMASHADVVSDFSGNVAVLGTDVSLWPPAKRTTALSMLVHCADLGNPGKPLPLSLNWSARVTHEFFAQGDAERAAGLPISRLCDRNDTDICATQLAFMSAIVAPSFSALAALTPATSRLALLNVASNRAFWQAGKVPWREWLSPSFCTYEPSPYDLGDGSGTHLHDDHSTGSKRQQDVCSSSPTPPAFNRVSIVKVHD